MTCHYDGTFEIYDLDNPSNHKTLKDAYTSYCEDCHYQKVLLNSYCKNSSCVSCIRIGGDKDDISETGEINEPMEKCFLRADTPYFDNTLNSIDA